MIVFFDKRSPVGRLTLFKKDKTIRAPTSVVFQTTSIVFPRLISSGRRRRISLHDRSESASIAHIKARPDG